MTLRALSWQPDPLEADDFSVDPVTAWVILSQAAELGEPNPDSFYMVLDAASPLDRLKQGKPLQDFVKCVPQNYGNNQNLGEALRAGLATSDRHLFPIPLHKASLPEDVLDLTSLGSELPVHGHDQSNGAPPIFGLVEPLPLNRLGTIRPRVIIGIIDYAINVAHARFQHLNAEGQGQSRVAHAWLQDGRFQQSEKVRFGCEFHGSEITEALNRAEGDDEAALRQLGLLSFEAGAGCADLPPKTQLARRTSHGTHVLDLAAGRDPSDPRGMEVQIVAVMLPDSVSRDTTGTSLGLFFLSGLQYILQRTRQIAAEVGEPGEEPIPILICASLGFSGGPRRGRHLIEGFAQALIAHHHQKIGAGANDVRVVLPAGNSNLARGHAVSARGMAVATLSATWRLQPGDQTSNHLEAWIAHSGDGAPESVEITLVPPGGVASPLPKPLVLRRRASMLLVLDGTGGTIGRVALEATRDGPWRLSLALAPTDPGATGLAAATAGAWGVEIVARAPEGSDVELEVCAWILRDDDPVEHRANARQSYFDCPDYLERDHRGAVQTEDPRVPASSVRRSGSLNTIATGGDGVVVAGYVQPPTGATGGSAPRAADYSSAPLAPGRLLAEGEGVDWAAPCESSAVLPGVLAAGSRCGSLVAMNGTSVAVPQVVRAMVEDILGASGGSGMLPLVDFWGAAPSRLGARPIRSPWVLGRADPRAAERLHEPRV